MGLGPRYQEHPLATPEYLTWDLVALIWDQVALIWVLEYRGLILANKAYPLAAQVSHLHKVGSTLSSQRTISRENRVQETLSLVEVV